MAGKTLEHLRDALDDLEHDAQTMAKPWAVTMRHANELEKAIAQAYHGKEIRKIERDALEVRLKAVIGAENKKVQSR